MSCPSDIKRFFVTPTQSGQICLLATFLGESGNIFFPKLDFKKDQVYFKDIALDFLKDKGYCPVICNSEKEAKDYKINTSSYPIFFFKSDTSGEKSFEEFYTDSENFELKKYKSLGFIKTNNIKISFENVQKDFINIFKNNNATKSDIVYVIKKYIPDFNHIEKGKNLDQKM